ncbi:MULTISPECIES: PspA/IM30 family protein [unclassified Leptolyngbya]|uniref:PspA/IM30 family protein n=1 Tax=unclassified Leptolyngbya TaxID=2650499 RepID=UPI001685A971|nr:MULTISPECIES: PspA/IM30 family protein [unclassified Leptolyngbya]MBD1913166.1 PspA/IM30 family protein [Leptolyngbya sp. FACHB-8]MBD2158795.1 PspA/IM30 family protein [Leptolyngbya sp. FACHB-16]
MKQLFYWLLGDKTGRGVVYWLLGDRAAQTLIALWNWLWGIPIESGGKIAVEAAQESLYSMQEAVQQLTESVAKMTASYQRAQQKYNAKQKELEGIQQQALLAQRQNNVEAARLAMGKAILIERLLPILGEQVSQAEQILTTHRERLQREQQRLETYKLEMQNLKDLSEVNEALKTITQINNSLEVTSARSQFEAAQSSIQRRYLRTNALAELSESPTEKLNSDLEKLTLDDEINQRLQQIDSTSE